MIEDILPRKTVIADGVLTEVAFDFEVVNADYIKVYLNGVIQNSGWSLSDNKIIFTSAPSANTTITVIRDLPVNYISPIKSRGALTSDKIDEHLSEMTAKVQTLSEKISRVPTYPVDTLLTGEQIAEDFLEKFQKSSDNLASISEAKDEVVTAKVDGIKALNDETARLTAQVANAIDGKVDTAENAATSAENFAETSKQWAIKMDDKVANEDYSAKYYANQAQISASLTKLNDKLTNCLLNVPQDIKLELNDGTLTLKAGSKVYVPNGVGVFKEILINSDISLTDATNYNNLFVFYIDGRLERILYTQVFSGTDAPSNNTFMYWYDTTNNLIKRTNDGGDTWTTGNISFPLGLFSTNGTGFSSIDHVFNGFGYIGNTKFLLPGLKGLASTGRNADGSYLNAEIVIDEVKTETYGTTSITDRYLLLTTGYSGKFFYCGVSQYFEQEEEPPLVNYNMWYRPSTGKWLRVLSGAWVDYPSVIIDKFNVDSTGRITSFNPKLPVKLADDQEVVHKTGNEPIEGEKIFTSNITVSNPNGVSIMQCVDPANTNNNAKIQYYVGDNSASFANVQNGSTIGGIRIDNSGYAYSIKPPVAGDNSNEIATTNWCYDPAKSTNLVHRSGSETIAGTKTFLPDSRTIYLKDDETILANNPSVDRYPCRFIWLDKNNIQLGYMQIYEYTNGNRNVGIGIRNKQNTTFHALSVWVEPNGTAYVTVPSPSSSDNSTKVPTTAWVRSYVKTGGAQLDYTKGVTITGNGTKTTSFAGVLMINASKLDNQGNEQVTLTINGQTFYYGNGTVNLDHPHIGQIYFPMKSGQSYNISSPNWSKITAKFFPYA